MQKFTALALFALLSACRGEELSNAQSPDASSQLNAATDVKTAAEQEPTIYEMFSTKPAEICSNVEVLNKLYEIISDPYRNNLDHRAQIALSVHNEGRFSAKSILLSSYDNTSKKVDCEATVTFSHPYINKKNDDNTIVNFVSDKIKYSAQPTVSNDDVVIKFYNNNEILGIYVEIKNVTDEIFYNMPYAEIRNRVKTD